jgi:hypothetical protein
MSNSTNPLTERYYRMMAQSNEYDEKEKQVLTRSRMLQVAQERNIFARKLFYTLISIVALIVVLTLVIYSYRGTRNVANR